MSKQHLVFFTEDEMINVGVIVKAIVDGGGEVHWKLPVSEEWLKTLKSAHAKLDAKIEEISNDTNGQ